MRSKRLSSRGTEVGIGSGGSGSTSSSFAATTTTTCHPISELDESVAIDAKELRELMDDSATGLETALEGEEEEEDEGDEDRDQYVADLCSRFEGAAMTTAKRKFSDAVAEEEENEANGSLGDGGSTRSSGGASACSATAVNTTTAPEKRIRTVLRVRPVGPDAGPLSLKVVNSSTVTTTKPPAKSRYGGLTTFSTRLFEYPKVLNETTQQEAVFNETVKPLVAGLFEAPSKNGMGIAYGATNAGKTHTIMGAPGNNGVLPRALEDMFLRVQQNNVSAAACAALRVNLRVVEVYKNYLYDLLSESEGRGAALTVNETQRGGDVIDGLSSHHPADLGEALKFVERATDKATRAETALNAASSRGHTVWMIELQRLEGEGSGEPVAASKGRGGAPAGASSCNPRLWLFDLAGSERIDRSKSDVFEANNINIDLSALFNCLKQSETNKKRVSYRTRTLTRMMKGMLVKEADITGAGAHNPGRFGWTGGASASSAPAKPRLTSCVMIVNVHPALSEYGETQKVLTNALISMKARAVEERPRCTGGGGESAVYGMNGHLVFKRQKSSHSVQRPGADRPVFCAASAASGQGEARGSATTGRPRGGSSLGIVTGSRDEQARKYDELKCRFDEAESENTELKERLGELEEELEDVDEERQEFRQMFNDGVAKLEEDRDTWKAKTIRLREQLDATTANAAAGDSRALALAVQSARKMSKNVTALSKRLDLHSDNVRENEDELSRAAAIIAEKDAQVARAGQTLADARQEEAAVRTELAESKADIARVGAALGAATARVEAVETEIVGVKSENERLGGKNADLREESAGFKRDQEELRVESSRVKGENAGLAERLGTAQEEIGRLEEALACAEEAEVSTVQMNISRESFSSSESAPDEPPLRSSSSRKSGSGGKRTRKRSSGGGSLSIGDCSGPTDGQTGAMTLQASRTTRRVRSTRSTRFTAVVGEDKGDEGCANYPVVVDDQSLSGDCVHGHSCTNDRNEVVAVVGDSHSSSSSSSSREGGATESGASPSPTGSGSAEISRVSPSADQMTPVSPPEGESNAHDEDDEGTTATAGEPAVAQTRSALTRHQRKPLGNLTAADVVGNGSGNSGKDVELGMRRWAGAGLEKAQPLWRGEVADSKSPKTRALRDRKERTDARAREENERQKREKEARAVARRADKARCQAARADAMLSLPESKPEPQLARRSRRLRR